MLIGKKSNLEAGYVFAPYIMMSSIVSNFNQSNRQEVIKSKISKIFNINYTNEQFYPRKSIMSRYSKKIVNSKFYSEIEIN